MDDDQVSVKPVAGSSSLYELPARLFYRLVVGHLFHRYFNAVPAQSEALKKRVYRIRYSVYCHELGWEDPAKFPDRMEYDDYDNDSQHVLLYHRPSDTFAGCVRLVRASAKDPERPFPFELSCRETLYPEARELLAGRRPLMGEISRLAVRATFRRRSGDKAPLGELPKRAEGDTREHRRRAPHIAMGLYVAAACSGLQAGLEGVFALMEPRLAARLSQYSLKFRQMGDPIEHRGQRAPFFISREMLYGGIDPKVRGLLDVIDGDLRRGMRAPPSD